MGIRATNIQSTLQSVDIICSKADERLLSTFQYIGEACVREARIKANFKDQTGNLRSSIGYVILMNGKLTDIKGFDPVRGSNNGSNIGETFAKRLAQNSLKNKGCTLIVVAGMNYASHVVARGYDVLDSSELLAKKLVPRLLNQLNL